MRVLIGLAVCGLVAAGGAIAQSTGAGGSAGNPVQSAEGGGGANAGRKQLSDFLNGVAAGETAARRKTVETINTRAGAEARQQQVRSTILRLMGTLPERTPLNARTTGTTAMEGFRVDKVLFDSQPNFPVTALLYVPAPPSGSASANNGKFPAIVMAPGHSPAGKAGDVAMATAFAKAGFVVLSYDPIGQGERLQYPDPNNPGHTLSKAPTGEHGEAGLQPTLIGDAVAQYFLWDGMRAVDYMQARAEVDPKRIGAFGCSGGGAMTALLGALDTRVAAVGTACYWTSYDTLLPSIGPQDAEQSIPGFIAAGLDFPDWVEVAAPRPYAMIATTSDMFPFAGAKTTEAEARRFYGLLEAGDRLQFITGPGGHGNLRPITPQILRFFAGALRPDPAYATNLPPVTDPFDAKANPPRKPGERPVFPPPPPASLVQVTPTGQVATSYPGAATVFTLNKVRADRITTPQPRTLADLQRAVRAETHAEAQPAGSRPSWSPDPGAPGSGFPCGRFSPQSGEELLACLTTQTKPGRHPAVLVLREDSGPASQAEQEQRKQLLAGGSIVFEVIPRPSPPGTEETKSPLLGPFYLTELRAELAGKTLLGLRVDDAIRAADYLLSRPDVDPNRISAVGAGHMALVLLHAVVLDQRLKQITVSGGLSSYRELVNDPVPKDAPQDILPGVLRRYDLPDVRKMLGARLASSPQGQP